MAHSEKGAKSVVQSQASLAFSDRDSLDPCRLTKPRFIVRHQLLNTARISQTDEFNAGPSSRTIMAGSDVDFDDVKSTGSSHPFSSPNPSEFDEHGTSFTSGGSIDPQCSNADKRSSHKRRKHTDPSGHSTPGSRLTYPLSERQQLALLMQMTAPDQHGDQPKSPAGACGAAGGPSLGFGGSFASTSLLTTSSTLTPVSANCPSSSKPRGKMAKIFRRNDRGETILHMAAKRGDKQQCVELIKEGADVNTVDYAGWTPLHEACNKGWLETAQILIDHGANVNACGLEDDTPLHDAALNGNTELLTLLLKSGADPLKCNAKGKRPIDVADDEEIKNLLEKYALSIQSDSSSTPSSIDNRFNLTIVETDSEDTVAAIGSDNVEIDTKPSSILDLSATESEGETRSIFTAPNVQCEKFDDTTIDADSSVRKIDQPIKTEREEKKAEPIIFFEDARFSPIKSPNVADAKAET